MPDRIPCVVPFCGRTRKGSPPSEWICADHWRGVPWKNKLVLARARRRRDRPAWDLAWTWCKRWAIERAAGISR